VRGTSRQREKCLQDPFERGDAGGSQPPDRQQLGFVGGGDRGDRSEPADELRCDWWRDAGHEREECGRAFDTGTTRPWTRSSPKLGLASEDGLQPRSRQRASFDEQVANVEGRPQRADLAPQAAIFDRAMKVVHRLPFDRTHADDVVANGQIPVLDLDARRSESCRNPRRPLGVVNEYRQHDDIVERHPQRSHRSLCRIRTKSCVGTFRP
jgi:hypothetical protein